jgi:hypothetical protein
MKETRVQRIVELERMKKLEEEKYVYKKFLQSNEKRKRN